MQKPTIVIAAGYEALFAYLLNPKGDPQLVKRIEFACDGRTDCPLVRWVDKRACYQELAGMIACILARYHCETWGLACRSEHVGPIRNELAPGHNSTLAEVVETDREPVNITNVNARFAALVADAMCSAGSVQAL